MIIPLITLFGIVILIILHELGHFVTAKKFNLKVEEFGVGFPPRVTGKKIGETLYSLNWLPLGGFVKISGEGEERESLEALPEEEKKRLFAFQKPWKKALVVSAGVIVNFVSGWLILFAVFLIGTPRGLIINTVQPNSPAAISGIQANDLVLGFGTPLALINERKDASSNEDLRAEFINFINTHEEQTIELLVRSDEKERVVSVDLKKATEEGRGVLGVQFTEVGIQQQSFFEALKKSFSQAVTIIILTVQSLGDLLRNLFSKAEISKDVIGPVGIFSFAYETGKVNLIYLLQLLSIISLNLAVLNLIPFPALDGGHLLFIAIEKLKGSPINKQVKLIANIAGVGLLLLLALVLTVRDVQNVFFS